MGKVITILAKVRAMNSNELFERFNHITRAQAIREYLAAKEDIDLRLEVRLAGEEIVKRMAFRSPMGPVITKKKK